MKNLKIFIVLTLLLIPFSLASFAYDNPSKPKLLPQERDTIITSGSSSNSTFNSTYNNLLNQHCPVGKVVNGTLANGTFICTTDQTGGGGGGDFYQANFTTAFNNNLTSALPLENRTIVNCNNVTGNSLCQTGIPTFSNVTTTDRFLSTLAGISGVWHQYFVLGTAIEIGRITSELGVFQIRSASNLDIYFSNDDTSAFVSASDTGYVFARSINGFFADDSGSNKHFQTNISRTTIYTNLSLNNKDLLDYWDGDCPTGNYTYGVNNNGTLKCRNDVSGSGGSVNNTYINQTFNNYYFNQTTVFFNNSDMITSGFSGTAVSHATLSYLPADSTPVTISTTYLTRAINITQDGYIGNLRVIRGTVAPSFNITLYRNGVNTGLACRLLNGGANGLCTNFTGNISVTKGQTLAWGVQSDNATTFTGYHITADYFKQTMLNVSAPDRLIERYNITANTALDTTYTNNYNRTIYLDVTAYSSVVNDDIAYVTLYTNGTYCSRAGYNAFINGVDIAGHLLYYHIGCYIKPYERWSLNTTLGGSGSVGLERTFATLI